jgi:hypothetical protein
MSHTSTVEAAPNLAPLNELQAMATFRRFFREIREAAPEVVTRVSMKHLAEHEHGPAERFMISSLCTSDEYLQVLFNPDFLLLDDAKLLADVMAKRDAQFPLKFSRWARSSR